MEYNQIICGDNLEVMPLIPNKSVNLIIADPPYNINKTDWDKIPNYIEWLGSRLLEMQRVLKDNGSFYLFHNDFLQMVEIQNWINKNSKFVFKQLIVWNKIHEDFNNNGFVQQRLSNGMMKNYYSGFTEYILFYTFENNESDISYYLRNEMLKAKSAGYTDKKLRMICGISLKGGGLLFHYWGKAQWLMPTEHIYKKLQTTGFFCKPYEDLQYPFNLSIVKNDLRANSNVWLYPPSEQNGHITPKPIELIKNILKHSSNENDLVLIPFVGSGNDCIACKELKRNFIGIENKLKYVEMARQRIRAIPELLF